MPIITIIITIIVTCNIFVFQNILTTVETNFIVQVLYQKESRFNSFVFNRKCQIKQA